MSQYTHDTGEPIPARTYDGEQDIRTKQAFKDECDVNRLLQRFQKDGAMSHLEAYGQEYGEYSTFDFHAQMEKLRRGNEIFAQLPSEIRSGEFENDPGRFFEYVNNPENVQRLPELFPALAKPGRFNLDTSSQTPPGATKEPVVSPTPQDAPSAPDEE